MCLVRGSSVCVVVVSLHEFFRFCELFSHGVAFELNAVGGLCESIQNGIAIVGFAMDLCQCSIGNWLVAMVERFGFGHLRSGRYLLGGFGSAY